jgi:hypothetical protein
MCDRRTGFLFAELAFVKRHFDCDERMMWLRALSPGDYCERNEESLRSPRVLVSDRDSSLRSE